MRSWIHVFELLCWLGTKASSGHYLHCLRNFPNLCVDSFSKYDLHAANGHTIDNANVLKKQGEEGLGNLGLGEHTGFDEFEGRFGT